jgi:PAS domain S-box-containing protein
MKAISESDVRFQAVFENASVGIARVAPDGRFLEVNQWLCNLLGYTRGELMTKRFSDLTTADDVATDLAAMRSLLAGEIEIYVRDKRYVRKDGSLVWGDLTTSLSRKPDCFPDFFI